MYLPALLMDRPVLKIMVLLSFLTGCRHDRDDKDEAKDPAPDGAGLPLIDMAGPIGGSRPVEVKTPLGYDPALTASYPLLLLLHGYSSDGARQDRYLGMSAQAAARGFIFAAPDGTQEPVEPKRFWNAGEICCNFFKSEVDDISYIRDLIRQISARYAVDPTRVYIFGHSNGAFMAHRFACDQSAYVTAIAGLAGSLRADPNDCKPERPVSVLTIHGTNDDTIKYDGGQFNPLIPRYPSAETTINRWAAVNGCDMNYTRGAPFTVLGSPAAPETTAIAYSQCASGGSAELWKIEGGSHIPAFDPTFVPKILDFFEAHKR